MPFVQQHGVFWLVSAVLAIAAVIDGRELRVPNRLTYSFALTGLAASLIPGGLGPWSSLAGLALGLVLLLPLYAVGGMGAGDVKLLAGVGAWIGPVLVLHAFVATAVVGAVMALAMMVASGRLSIHLSRMGRIAGEWATIRDPAALAAIAAERKPTMTLLPYGIPMAVGTIGYFAAAGLLF
jgi:prepilin peptidase CpaA